MAKKKNENEKKPEDIKQEAAPSPEEPETEGTPGNDAPEVNPLEAELKAEKEKYLRLAAEYDNFRKRSQKEREALYSDIRSDTISKLLPVYDNLERALSQETADEAYKKGVEMTMTQLKDIFSKMGITEIEAVGKPFDPAVHNAVMHVDDESLGENVVAEEFAKGFMLGDKVIRFSMVKVAN